MSDSATAPTTTAAAQAAIQADVLLAQTGDEAAKWRVWEAAVPVAQKIAQRYCAQYFWVDDHDLSADMLLALPRFISTYDQKNSSKTDWSKYLFFKLNFYAKDCLRREDPVGLRWPQKRAHPEFHRLGDFSLVGFDAPDTRECKSIDEQIDGVAGLGEELEISATVADCHELLTEIAPHRYSQKTGKLLSKKQPQKRRIRRRPKAKNRFSSFETFVQNRRKNAMENQSHQVESQPAASYIPGATYTQPEAQPQQPAAQPVAQPAAQPETQPVKQDKWTPARRARHEAAKAAGATKRKSPSRPSRPGAKRARPSGSSSAKRSQPASKELSAGELVALASKFIEAAGGVRSAAKLIEQIENLKK